MFGEDLNRSLTRHNQTFCSPAFSSINASSFAAICLNPGVNLAVSVSASVRTCGKRRHDTPPRRGAVWCETYICRSKQYFRWLHTTRLHQHTFIARTSPRDFLSARICLLILEQCEASAPPATPTQDSSWALPLPSTSATISSLAGKPTPTVSL